MLFKTACNPTVSSTPVALFPAAVGVTRIIVGNSDPGSSIFLHIFDLPAAQVTLGVTPPKLVLPVQAGSGLDHALPNFSAIAFDKAVTVAVSTALDTVTAPIHPTTVTIEYYS